MTQIHLKLNLFILLAALCLAVPVRAEAPAKTESPDHVLALLKAGNDRFNEGKSTHPNLTLVRREDTAANGQHPLATFLSCSDSRVPVEAIFDQGVGDVFIVRVAGNVAGPDEIGSLEYGVEHLGTPLLVVMGHSKCGAVTAAATHAEVGGSIPKILEHIMPAVESALKAHPGFEAKALIPEAITANVWQAIAEMLEKSEILREFVKGGKLKIVGAIYDIQTGQVRWLGPHPKEKELLGAGEKGAANGNGAKEAKHPAAAKEKAVK